MLSLPRPQHVHMDKQKFQSCDYYTPVLGRDQLRTWAALQISQRDSRPLCAKSLPYSLVICDSYTLHGFQLLLIFSLT